VPEDEEVRVRVRAASLNIADWYDVAGRPYVGRTQMGLRKPKTNRLGVDYAGTVEAVGGNVTEFRPGDEVFGGRNGAADLRIDPVHSAGTDNALHRLGPGSCSVA
jgi:NADPH:quinone reductase-like Zn-dependent oxidoreductase